MWYYAMRRRDILENSYHVKCMHAPHGPNRLAHVLSFVKICLIQLMATGATPRSSSSAETLAAALETVSRLEKCWKVDLHWECYPRNIQEVGILLWLVLCKRFTVSYITFCRLVNK